MYEDNPFEDEKIAQEWITSIEGEHGMIRDKELYPFLREWSEDLGGVLVDIGAGQGICADYVQKERIEYIGVDPSRVLIERAHEKYSKDKRKFIVGNAYDLPLEPESADIVLSVNTWFHLENLEKASRELFRILKPGGIFLISTANPGSYNYWEGMFDRDVKVSEKRIDGKVNIPVQSLSRNLIFKHTLEEIVLALKNNGLTVQNTIGFGNKEKFKPSGLFVNIMGSK